MATAKEEKRKNLEYKKALENILHDQKTTNKL
jgi:hypothetical protein